MHRPNEHDEEQAGLLARVRRLAWADTGELRCGEPDHPDGHVCLPAPIGEDALDAFRRALVERYGEARSLAADGRADPTATTHTGLPLLTPFGDRLVAMRGWFHGGRWIGLGAIRRPYGPLPVLLVAEGRSPADDLPEGTTWLGGVVAATGRDLAAARHPVDWADAEARLGTALPADYKQLAEVFGEGAFDDHLRLYVPGSDAHGSDLVGNALRSAEWARTRGARLWEPYGVYPAPGGLLQWGDTEQADTFHWLTEGDDPDRWPVLACSDDHDSWTRFDGTVTEFLHRVLTDRQHPYSLARHFDGHWFTPYGEDGLTA
ncbi:SMI1/KNR4 family protein [Streptomyces sp. NPDC088090]|uniref:SMI1/KNR4 family protein n=1 Tax=Streptomyces sp. NPDC088090 TaxID=3365822 RepID=UPI00384FF1A3